MANVEKSGYMKYKDKSGNMTTMYPKTKVANVEGLEDWDSAMLLKSAQATLPRAMSWRPVCYGNGKFVAVAYGTNIAAYSTDGVTWTQTAMPVNSTWRSVCYGDGKFVAVAASSKNVAVSADGVTWSSGIPAIKNPTGTDVTSDLRTVLGIDTAIQSAIQNTWEANY